MFRKRENWKRRKNFLVFLAGCHLLEISKQVKEKHGGDYSISYTDEILYDIYHLLRRRDRLSVDVSVDDSARQMSLPVGGGGVVARANDSRQMPRFVSALEGYVMSRENYYRLIASFL